MTRFVTDIPRPLYNQADLNAKRASLSMTRYFSLGHKIMRKFTSDGVFANPTSMIDMDGTRWPLPIYGIYPDLLRLESQTELKKLVMDLPERTSEEIDQLIQASPISTKTAYAIMDLGLLNGLVLMHDKVCGAEEPLSFQVVDPNQSQVATITNIILEL